MLDLLNLWTVAFALIMFFGMRFVSNSYYEDYLGAKYTNGIRGLLAVAVVLCHLTQQMQGGILFRITFTYVGPLCVAGFFFLSGYGCMTQYSEKGKYYLRGFLPKRLISVWIPLLIVAGLLIVEKLAIHESVCILDIIRSFINGDYFVPYSGFVVALSFFYILFYIGAKLETNGKRGGYSVDYIDNRIFPLGRSMLCSGTV